MRVLLFWRIGSSAARARWATVRLLTSRESPKGREPQAIVDNKRSVLEEVLLTEKKPPTTFTGKVAEKAEKTFLYGVVALSICAVGGFVYVLGEQFFAADSPNRIYSKALALVRDDPRCQDMFGPSIAGFGEDSGRGRRRHVAHHKYEKDGEERIRVMFHVKGERDEGKVQVEMAKRDGQWDYRFLFAENLGRPKITHVLIDNR